MCRKGFSRASLGPRPRLRHREGVFAPDEYLGKEEIKDTTKFTLRNKAMRVMSEAGQYKFHRLVFSLLLVWKYHDWGN